jgi:hypothetical protein
LESWRVVDVRAVADLGGPSLEAVGSAVLPAGSDLSAEVNSDRRVLSLDDVRIRVQAGLGDDVWEEVDSLALNLDQVVLLLPGDTPTAAAAESSRDARVKVVCPSVELTGFARVPLSAHASTLLAAGPGRFVELTQVRVTPVGAARLEDIEGLQARCLVNRAHVVACIESRPEVPLGPLAQALVEAD